MKYNDVALRLLHKSSCVKDKCALAQTHAVTLV